MFAKRSAEGRRRKVYAGSTLALAGAVIASAALLGFLGQRQYERLTTTEAWVANAAINPGELVQPEQVVRGRVKEPFVVGAIDDSKAIIGRRLNVKKEAGAVFRAQDFVQDAQPRLATSVPEGRVIYTLAVDKQQTNYLGQLRSGDRFDVLLTESNGRVGALATDVMLVGMMRDQRPASEPQGRSAITALTKIGGNDDKPMGDLALLAIDPRFAFALASARRNAGSLSFVVHSYKDVESGKRLSVLPSSATRRVEVYFGLQKKQVEVRR